MPRTFNNAIQGEIDKKFAGEPLIIVEIEWQKGFPVAYSDRKLSGAEYPYPNLVSIAPFDSTQIISGGSDSQQTSIVLNDIDGSIRAIIDSNDAHLKPVSIFLSFQGLNFASKALLFEGVINSPMVWDEGARTFAFDVLSKIESVEAGFIMEDGDFPFIEPKDRNNAWPLVFGEICNMETVTLEATRQGFMAEGQGVADPTIEERLCQARLLDCPTIERVIEAGSEEDPINRGFYGGLNEGVNVRQNKPDPQCVKKKADTICGILVEKEGQNQHVKKFFTVRQGNDFPQNQTITIEVKEVKFVGVMIGEVFTVQQVIHPNTPDNPPCVEIPDATWGYRFKDEVGDNQTTVEGCEQGNSTNFDQDVVNGDGEKWRYFNSFEESEFIWIPAGSTVTLAEESEILHIVSLLPGTVNQVAAYRNFGDISLLTSVDTELYTVQTTDYGGYNVVELVLNAPLSDIKDQDWDDEIFVSFTSSIGPSPPDIIQWLIETYTDLTIDTTSFASVKTSLTNYPSNFFIKARPKVIDLVQDIAFQARCGIFIRDNTVFMVYLPKEPTSLKTLTETDILPNSFRITHTDTEELETRNTISWSEGEAGVFKSDETDFEFVLKHKVPQYGIFDATYDYFTLNIFELVEKSATYWMIQNANTWKLVEFETPLVHLNLDIFDSVTINLGQFGPTKVVIISSTFNFDTNTISFTAWTPIRSGESEDYFWAWPAAQDALAVHPLLENTEESGDGFPLQVIPPIGSILRGAFDPNFTPLNTDGDINPSDLGDVLPTLLCKISTGNEISDDIEPVLRPFEPLAEKLFEDKLDNIESNGFSATSGDDGENENACGSPTGSASCTYEVTIFYVTSAAVTTNNNPPACGGPCGCKGPGRSCFGAQSTFCHSFGALFAATLFQGQKKAEAQRLWETCAHNCGVTDILNAGGIVGFEGGSGNAAISECEEVGEPPGDPDAPGANDGETKTPTQSGGTPISSTAVSNNK